MSIVNISWVGGLPLSSIFGVEICCSFRSVHN